MASLPYNPPLGGAFTRRFTRYSGLFFDEFSEDSAWLRETAVVRLPPMADVTAVIIRGEFRSFPGTNGFESGFPTLEIMVDGRKVAAIRATAPGPWEASLALESSSAQKGSIIYLRLQGTDFVNALAWLGRVTSLKAFHRYRAQNKNRQLRVSAIESLSGERIYDFSRRESPYSTGFARAHSRSGMNIVGFLTADLGIGESARCMVRAADAASIPVALVPLKLNCRNRLGDLSYSSRLQEENPYGVNVIHIDPPVARDIDHHHGAAFRKDKYNIGYFAWELPEFPDAWLSSLDYFDEIWCPSDFVRESLALKSPFPVLTMGHSISFERPAGATDWLRSRFGLPPEQFLFLCIFDLNSYSTRKNPRAIVDAFRRSGLAGQGAALVIKVQNAADNTADFAALCEDVRDLAGTVILNSTFSRKDIYALEAACDCYISLHRAEGFGLAIAECMYLSKPVIATNWSATAEYLNQENGYPVRCALVTLTENSGPYTKGSSWADPDTDHAAELMKQVVTNPAEAAMRGMAARRSIERLFSPSVIGARYRRRLEAIAGL